jgi:hypothetical protein
MGLFVHENAGFVELVMALALPSSKKKKCKEI